MTSKHSENIEANQNSFMNKTFYSQTCIVIISFIYILNSTIKLFCVLNDDVNKVHLVFFKQNETKICS